MDDHSVVLTYWRNSMNRMPLLLCVVLMMACGGPSLQQQCDAIKQEYVTALSEAKKCTAAVPDPCNVTVLAVLDIDGCVESVVAGREGQLEEIASRFDARGCPTRTVACPVINGFSCVEGVCSSF
jgi:hypothetical protein